MFEKCSVQETVERLRGHAGTGLTSLEAARRLAMDGENKLREPRKKTVAESFLEQLKDPLIYILLVAAAVSVALGEISDAVIIGVVVLLNAVVGVVQEGKARRALDSLKKLTSPHAVVIRDGIRKEIPAAELVKGDLVCLEAGCQVPADLRLVVSVDLKTEESALTGEALPVEKDALFLADCAREIPLGDRRNMVYMSTIVTYGRGEGMVTAVGMDTEIGRIASMITEAEEEPTPLQKKLGELGNVLCMLSLGLCAALFAVAVLQHRNVPEMLITAISLAVAAVPEGLPAVVTICLALSVTKMVRVNTIVRRLPSVETLGAVSVVCSDKTGTLTQNRMTVEKCWWDGRLEEVVRPQPLPELMGAERRHMLLEHPDFLQGMVLCNDASLKGGNRLGDPTELALLDLAEDWGIGKEALEDEMPRCGELPFDSDRKMMTTCHRKRRGFGVVPEAGDGLVSYTKGAPDEVLARCDFIRLRNRVIPLTEHYRRQIKKAAGEMAREALRTLAVAMRDPAAGPTEERLVFLGMMGMRDPVRPEAAEAVETFRGAGVETVMITGDHVETAYAIGRQLGIVERMRQCMTGAELDGLDDESLRGRLAETRVFARVSPSQKVRIVKGLKARGEIVAMTGDGVNDAPSLKAADIGIAMGLSGTDVAKQAADMILADDNFATIEKAIEEGRGVYENIRKSVIFLLSSNLGELTTMFLAVVCGFAAPLKSSHILWINLITDSLPALALGIDKNDGESLMRNAPRKARESLFSRGGLSCTCFYGALIAGVSLAAFLLPPCSFLRSRGLPVDLPNLKLALRQELLLARAQTYAFTTLGMSQLFHAVGMRDVQKSVFRMKHLENKLMIAACVIGFALQFAVTEFPPLIAAFGTSHLSLREWGSLAFLAAFPLFAHECVAWSHGRRPGRT